MQRLLWITPFFFLLLTCTPKIKRQFCTELSPINNFTVPPGCEGGFRVCRNKMNYIPDTTHPDHTLNKVLRVNFHFMCKTDSTFNFDQQSARVWTRQILFHANEGLKKNAKMRLPLGHQNPTLDAQLRLKLTSLPDNPEDDGIYHHYDDELFFMLAKGKHRNHHRREVFEKYAVQPDSVMNIFVMAVHPDSVGSPTYRPIGRGIAFGTWLKIGAWHFGAKDSTRNSRGQLRPNRPAWFACRELNHEILHNLGLRHSWRYNDGCEDTPKNPNCWNKSDTPPCDSLWGNNIMDYNAYQNAITPCQIGTIHYNLSKKNYKVRPLLEKTWCQLKEKKSIIIKDTLAWNSAKDLEGHLIIAEGGLLIMRCRTSIPPGGKIIVAPGAQLILDGATLENDCGKTWEGIEIQRRGKLSGSVNFLGDVSITDVVHAPQIIAESTDP